MEYWNTVKFWVQKVNGDFLTSETKWKFILIECSTGKWLLYRKIITGEQLTSQNCDT